jgi:hypothetical protein
MTWKRLLAYITGSVDEQLVLQNEYLVTENRILRRQLQRRLKLMLEDNLCNHNIWLQMTDADHSAC